jgi:hypothetical protein
MVKSAENRNYFRLLMLKVVPDISWPKKSRHYFDPLNEREIAVFPKCAGP